MVKHTQTIRRLLPGMFDHFAGLSCWVKDTRVLTLGILYYVLRRLFERENDLVTGGIFIF